MSEFLRTRFFFIMVMVSLSMAQAFVVHVGQKTTMKFQDQSSSLIPLSIINHHP